MTAESTLLKTSTAQDFQKKTGLEPSYRESLKNYEKIVDARCAWAHESENEFARLLLSEKFQENAQRLNVGHWKKLLLWVYEKDTLEEMADLFADGR
ncbi:hypothetical protein MMC28_003741 [Mycoblastus sanguinarius]|nr:hypothetical protein [Mycoblastus sanguinarius]